MCWWQGADEGVVTSMSIEAMQKLDLTKESQQGTVKKFFNRMLMLPVAQQNLLFALFITYLDVLIGDAKRAGIYDQGDGFLAYDTNGCGKFRWCMICFFLVS